MLRRGKYARRMATESPRMLKGGAGTGLKMALEQRTEPPRRQGCDGSAHYRGWVPLIPAEAGACKGTAK